MKVELVCIGDKFDGDYITSYYNNLPVASRISKYFNISDEFVSSLPTGMIGIDSDAFIEEVFSLMNGAVCDSEERSYLCLTFAAINSNKRIFVTEFKGRPFILVSLSDVLNNYTKDRTLFVEIYCALQLLEKGSPLIHENHSSNCFFRFKFRRKGNTLCEKCRESLTDDGRKHIESIAAISAPKAYEREHHVILFHGIRTQAPWIDACSDMLKADFFGASTHRYGYFNLIQFLFNSKFGQKPVDLFYEEYIRIRRTKPKHSISVIAHSFGALVVSQALTKYEDLVLNKVILVGGVVPEDYNWNYHVENKRLVQVLNECGDSDLWPIIAKKCIPNAGASGTLFFNRCNDKVINVRYSGAGHSDLLNVRQYRNSWKVFLDNPIYTLEREEVDVRYRVKLLNLVPGPKLFARIFKKSKK